MMTINFTSYFAQLDEIIGYYRVRNSLDFPPE